MGIGTAGNWLSLKTRGHPDSSHPPLGGVRGSVVPSEIQQNPPRGLQQICLARRCSVNEFSNRWDLERPSRLGTHVRMGMTPDLAAATEREVETRRDRRCRRPDVERTADRRRKPPRAIRTRHAVHGRRVHASSLVASEVQGCQINRSGTATLNQFHCQRDQ